MIGFAIGRIHFADRGNDRWWLIVVNRRPFVRWKVIRPWAPWGGIRCGEVMERKWRFKIVRGITIDGEPVTRPLTKG